MIIIKKYVHYKIFIDLKRCIMNQECELLANCGFFKKYQSTNDIACKGLIRQYCKGPLMDRCKRKEYRTKHNAAPPDEMMPSGRML
jgi:hypothetical protein